MERHPHVSTPPVHIGLRATGNCGNCGLHNPGYKLLGKLGEEVGAAHFDMLDSLLLDCGRATP